MFYNGNNDKVLLNVLDEESRTSVYLYDSDRFHYTYAGMLFEGMRMSAYDIKSFKGKVTREKLTRILQLIDLNIMFNYPDHLHQLTAVTDIRIPRKHFAKFVEIINS